MSKLQTLKDLRSDIVKLQLNQAANYRQTIHDECVRRAIANYKYYRVFEIAGIDRKNYSRAPSYLNDGKSNLDESNFSMNTVMYNQIKAKQILNKTILLPTQIHIISRTA